MSSDTIVPSLPLPLPLPHSHPPAAPVPTTTTTTTTMPAKGQLALTDKLPMPKCAVQIPRLGFGVYQSSPAQCVASCTAALRVGYRHIDTAQFYGNEAEVGAAVRSHQAASPSSSSGGGPARADIFVTTKILAAAGSFAKSLQKCSDSVDRIGGRDTDGGYVDCFLIHSPSGGKEKRKEMWLALEKLYEMGRTKSIGVSNFGVGHIEEMKAYARVWPPHVNQIEVSFVLFSRLRAAGCGLCLWHRFVLSLFQPFPP